MPTCPALANPTSPPAHLSPGSGPSCTRKKRSTSWPCCRNCCSDLEVNSLPSSASANLLGLSSSARLRPAASAWCGRERRRVEGGGRARRATLLTQDLLHCPPTRPPTRRPALLLERLLDGRRGVGLRRRQRRAARRHVLLQVGNGMGAADVDSWTKPVVHGQPSPLPRCPALLPVSHPRKRVGVHQLHVAPVDAHGAAHRQVGRAQAAGARGGGVAWQLVAPHQRALRQPAVGLRRLHHLHGAVHQVDQHLHLAHAPRLQRAVGHALAKPAHEAQHLRGVWEGRGTASEMRGELEPAAACTSLPAHTFLSSAT